METQTLAILAVVAAILIVVGLVAVVRRRRAGMGESSTHFARTSGVLAAVLQRTWGSGLDDATWNTIEEGLLGADLGVEATTRIVAGLRASRPQSVEEARSDLAGLLRAELSPGARGLSTEGDPAIMLVVGVNGSGKTTTIAKLAHRLKANGDTVLLGAADTFRAAAGEQLETWADRIGVGIVTGQEGGDPASVAFDAVAAARARRADVVIIDTAGRLHGKKNLMGELAKIHRVAGGEEGVNEVLLVLDATAGQNGLAQVKEFRDTVPVTGIVLTKLDGTAKGGIVVAVENELGIPVKLVGVGESMDDLEFFDPDRFVASLLEES